jgi:hypothetical protein
VNEETICHVLGHMDKVQEDEIGGGRKFIRESKYSSYFAYSLMKKEKER